MKVSAEQGQFAFPESSQAAEGESQEEETPLVLPEVGAIIGIRGRHGSWKVVRLRPNRTTNGVAIVVRELVGDGTGYAEYFVRPEAIKPEKPKRRKQ